MARFNLSSLYDEAMESLNKFSLGKKKEDREIDKPNPNNKELKVSPEELDKALAEMQKKGKDGLDTVSTAILTALGAAGGMASAGAIAGAVGATSITGLTTAASLIGVTAVAATPVGWIIGAGVAGAALFGGGAWLKGNSAVQTERRRLLKENLQEKLAKLNEEQASATEDDKIKRIAEVMRVALLQDRIPQELAGKIYVGFKEGTLSSKEALSLISAQCNEINVIDVENSFNINNKLIEARTLLKEAYLNKKISQKLGMQLLGTLETPQINYSEVDDITNMLSELNGQCPNVVEENGIQCNSGLTSNSITNVASKQSIYTDGESNSVSNENMTAQPKTEISIKSLKALLINAVKTEKITTQQAQMFATMVKNKQITPEQLYNLVDNM